MLGRKKKRNASISSVDMLNSFPSPIMSSNSELPGVNPTSTPSISLPKTGGMNYWVERARGAVGLGGSSGRARTLSEDGASLGSGSLNGRADGLSSSPSSTGSIKSRGFFSKNTNSDHSKSSNSNGVGNLNSNNAHGTSSESSGKSGTLLFSRATTTSLVSRPSWLSIGGSIDRSRSPLTASPSSPALSLAASGGGADSRWKNDREVYMEGGRRLATLTGSETDLGDSVKYTPNKAFSRSVDELSRFPTPTEDPRPLQRDPSRSANVEPARNFTVPSLGPAAVLHISTSAPSTSKSSRKPSSLSSSFQSGSQGSSNFIPSTSPVPFPTSSSTPNLSPRGPEEVKRDSQTIVCQGFLQRKADYAPPKDNRNVSSPSSPSNSTPYLKNQSLRTTKSEVDLQKGWKPYRVMLKGSKLYLHKLPTDLSTTAKLLFPTTIVPIIIKPFEVPSPKKNNDESGKKKPRRAFWGTGASHHPDLMVGEKGKGRVKGGTLEALVHELVFASSFAEDGEKEAGYESFMETLLLIWPFLPFSSSQSASELDRCSGLAVRTALESMNRDPEGSTSSTKALAKRLEGIVETICRFYPEDLRNPNGTPSDSKAALGELVRHLETLPAVEEGQVREIVDLVEKSFAERIPSKSIPPTEWTSSRPVYSRAGSSSSASSSPSKPKKQTIIDSELPSSISASAFLTYDPSTFASQIILFHSDRLNAITGQCSVPRHILRTAFIIISGGSKQQNSITSLFSFSPSKPHFLSRMVLETVFESPMSPPSSYISNVSPAEVRASVISHWIKVGEESKRLGDITSWMAIAFAFCSRSIARLEETWRLVAEDQVDLVRREWAPVLAAIGFVDFEESPISPLGLGVNRSSGIPYFGSILDDTMNALRLARKSPSIENPGVVDLIPFYELKEKLDVLSGIWNQDEGVSATSLDVIPNRELQFLFQTLSRQLPSTQIKSYLGISLEAEPKFAENYATIFRKVRSSVEPSPLLPLILVEPLPHISLIDREKVISLAARAIPRKSSNSAMSNTASVVPTMSLKKSTTSLSNASAAGGSGTVTPDSKPLTRHNSYPLSSAPSTENISNFDQLRSEIANPSDTLLRFGDGDLIFRIIASAALPIVPPVAAETSNKRGVLTRTSSWIESRTPPGGSVHESGSPNSRRGSRSFSIPAISLEPTSPKVLVAAGTSEPVSVVLKAGTFDSLVDILVFGIDKLRTPTIDADGVISLTGGRPLNLDLEEYRATFFATYRTFSTPLALLDMFRKRYLAAPNACEDYLTLSASKPFPNWSSSQTTEESKELDWNQISVIRFAILESLRFWFENHLSDFLDDEDLYASVQAFFLSVQLIEEASSVEKPEDDLLLEEVKSLKQRFYRKSLRPLVQTRLGVSKVIEKSADLSFDLLSVTDLVDKLDAMACGITRDVTANDLLRYAELLEMVILLDPIALYSTRLLHKTDDEDIMITDPYSHIRAIGIDPNFVKKMPASLQFGLRVHTVLRRWILCHLIDPELSVVQRKHRMLKALDIVEVCRSRMSGVLFGGVAEAQRTIQDPSLASFVERAVISAIVAPESRAYASAWYGVQISREASSCDTLAGLLQSNLFVTDKTACLDLAWLNERLLEIATQVENYSERSSINFDKRRWLYNTVKNALAIQPSQVVNSVADTTLEQMERRLSGWGNWNSRALRDVASSEGTRNTRSIKPFHRIVAQQQEKVRRDKQAREFVMKGIKLEQQGRLQKEKEVIKSTEKTRSRRMTAIFRSVRPISTQSSSMTSQSINSSLPSPESLRNLKDWTPTTKPYLVLALSGVEVHSVDNAQRSFVFELSTEDGQRSLFQAKSQEEMSRWIKELVGSGTQIAFRRATFLAQSPLFEEPESNLITHSPKLATIPAASRGPPSSLVFGVPLWELLQREDSSIPHFIEAALEFIEARGLTEVGIYRISGENRVVHEMKDALNKGYSPSTLLSTPNQDVHNITSLVKLFLRELPDPLIPHSFYDAFIEANSVEGYDDRLYAIRDLVWKLPKSHFSLLRRLAEHMDKVTDNEEVNAMHASNLALVLAPTLLQPVPGPNSFGISMTNLGKAANLIKSLILQEVWIFGQELESQEQEQEVEVEVEVLEVVEATVVEEESSVISGIEREEGGEVDVLLPEEEGLEDKVVDRAKVDEEEAVMEREGEGEEEEEVPEGEEEEEEEDVTGSYYTTSPTSPSLATVALPTSSS